MGAGSTGGQSCTRKIRGTRNSCGEIEDEVRIGFWDALICAAALKTGAERILSEDFNAGQKIGGIRVINPFAHLKAEWVSEASPK
jgi:predicted nucleic acid-binding protein